MSLKEKLSASMKEAMKVKDQVKLGSLRMALAAIKNREIELKAELDDGESMKVLAKLAKQRAESIELYRQGGRQELAEKEAAELAVIEAFLPAALSDDEIHTLVAEAVQEAGASGPKDMGKVMKAVGPKVAGRADGKKVSEAVKAALAKM